MEERVLVAVALVRLREAVAVKLDVSVNVVVLEREGVRVPLLLAERLPETESEPEALEVWVEEGVQDHECVPEMDCEGGDGVPDAVCVGDEVAERVRVGPVGERLEVEVCVGEAERVRLGRPLEDLVGVGVGDAEDDPVELAEALVLLDRDGLLLSEWLVVLEPVCVTVGRAVIDGVDEAVDNEAETESDPEGVRDAERLVERECDAVLETRAVVDRDMVSDCVAVRPAETVSVGDEDGVGVMEMDRLGLALRLRLRVCVPVKLRDDVVVKEVCDGVKVQLVLGVWVEEGVPDAVCVGPLAESVGRALAEKEVLCDLLGLVLVVKEGVMADEALALPLSEEERVAVRTGVADALRVKEAESVPAGVGVLLEVLEKVRLLDSVCVGVAVAEALRVSEGSPEADALQVREADTVADCRRLEL